MIFKDLCLLFLTDYCYTEFFVELNFLHVDCLKAAVSKGLGLAIVAGSLLVKVPQLLKIFNAKSGQGISIFGTSLEIFAMISNVSYSFCNSYPFSSYGDGFFVLVQTALIGTLVLHYGGSFFNSIAYLASVMVTLLFLSSGLLPLSSLWSLQAVNIPIVFFGKMVQAVSNFKNKSTGQLSLVTATLLFFGTLARIFTSIQETGDAVIIIAYGVASFANGIILSQILYYWTDATKSKKKKKH